MSQEALIHVTFGTFWVRDRRLLVIIPTHIAQSTHTEILQTLLDLQLLSAVISTPVTEPVWLPYLPNSELESG